jgi:hypothetical protein
MNHEAMERNRPRLGVLCRQIQRRPTGFRFCFLLSLLWQLILEKASLQIPAPLQLGIAFGGPIIFSTVILWTDQRFREIHWIFRLFSLAATAVGLTLASLALLMIVWLPMFILGGGRFTD